MCKKHKELLRMVAFCGTAIIFFFVASNAQVITSSITGRVVDGQGNVVPGAKVVVTNRATGAERTVVTNSSGDYVVTNLPPGRYDVTAEAATFSRALIEDVEINVGGRQNVNFSLQPGNIEETVTITSTPPLVETTRSELDTSISPREIENLPLLNRTFAGLSVIAPEARPVGTFDPTKTRVGTIAFNGGDGRQVNVNVDGGDNKDNVVGSLLQNFSYESIQEFQVGQHQWTADQGRSVGGVVNVITKSGGNQVRGSFFANFRDNAIQRRDFFDKLANRDNPEFQRQEFGGSIGGPIVRDRAFFFFALERFRERQNVPIFPSAVADLQLIPGVQFVSEIPTPYDDTLLSAKIDHRLNSKQSMFYRFSFQDNSSPNDQVANPARTDLSGGNRTTNRLYSFVVNHTYNIRPTVLNQFIFHFQDFVNEILPNAEGLTLSFPGGISIGQNANTPQSTKERKFQFRNDLSWIKGNHTMKYGVNYIHTILDGYFYFGTRGYSLTFRFTPSQIVADGGFNRDDLLQSLTYNDGASSHYQVVDQLAFYVQDDWKVTRRLTLNLGLRWDANIGNLPTQDRNRTMIILSGVNHPLAQALTGDQEKLRRTTPSWTEFQPRVGFAYDPTGEGRTVIRGGYGIFYDQIFQNLSLFSDVQSQPEVFQSAINWQRPHPDLTTFRYGTSALPQVPPGFSYANLAVGSVGRINDPDATEPYVQKWSIGVQHEFSRNWSISSDYVHTLGLNEPRFLNINPLISRTCNALYGGDPNSPQCPRGTATRVLDTAFLAANLPANRLNQINMFATNNRSLFDSWATTLKYRSGRWLFNASYVLSSSRSWGGQPTASYSGNGIAITPDAQFADGEFGPTRMDERHRIVLNGVFNLPWNVQVSPIMQFATARPYSATAGFDVDGDGLTTIDRLCAGVSPAAVFAVRGNLANVQALNPFGCQQARINSIRKGFVLNGSSVEERSGNFFNFDLRIAKTFRFAERYGLSGYLDLYNLFNHENLSYASRIGLSSPASTNNFLLPQSLFGPGFGPPVGRPLTAQLGFRFTF
ncbi:MAG TPA: TonB-dependent receptor [Pyrinomonadaceae bacterium]|nr:TonB-dependent receptor [Pyrinomonadaceae bacterium]HMP66768.1 TonB-dependent receptor [Pyrinomonadaceae bacterium]